MWYESNMIPTCESVHDGSNGRELLFKARSQSLEFNARIYRWNAESIKTCKVCDMHVEQSVSHMIVECMAYEKETIVLMNKVKAVFGDDFFERWFVDKHKGMCKLLGLNECSDRILQAMKSAFGECTGRKFDARKNNLDRYECSKMITIMFEFQCEKLFVFMRRTVVEA